MPNRGFSALLGSLGSGVFREAAGKAFVRITVAVLFAAALILIEAGIGAIALAGDSECREEAERMRSRFVADNNCFSGEGSQFFQVLLKGAFLASNQEAGLLPAVGVNLMVHAAAAAAASLMRLKWGLLFFLFIHLAQLLGGTLAAVLVLYTT